MSLNSVRKPRQFSTIYCTIWLVDFWPIAILVKYILHIFNCSVLRFPIQNSSKKSTKSTSCFIFLFEISKITKLMKKKLKRATVSSSWEIWCSNQKTGKFDEKLGDSHENRENWQVWGCLVSLYTGVYSTSTQINKSFQTATSKIYLLPLICWLQAKLFNKELCL